jgi:hypothetical protein
MALGDDKLYFSPYQGCMAGSTVEKLLDPMGEPLQEIARGRRGAGRLEVTVAWPQIEKALDAGATVTMLWEALSKQGLVSIKLRGFTREVTNRRKGVRGLGAAAKPAAEPGASAGSAAASAPERPDPPAQAGAAEAKPAEVKPGIPHRAWRTGPRQAPDPTKVFKPRDPLADEEGE